MSETSPHHPIAIAGMHRSGTSMLTRALHDSGLHLIGQDAEELISAAEDNPEGFWEHRAVVACNDELLEATGGSWDHPPELGPQGADDPRVAHLVESAEAALAGLRAHSHWGFKDPRVCLTAPFWMDLQPDLRFVVCLRHPLEVALSLKRRNQNSYSLGLALWERYYATTLATVPPERRIVSHYDAFFVDPEAELARVCEFAGLRPAPTHVRRDLRHHTIDVDLVDAGASESLRALYTTLCREAGVAVPSAPPSDEGRVRRLILDGAVAAQHAEQRLVAIERLEEREREFRAQHAANEDALRARVRDLERELADTRAVALRRIDEMARQVQAVHHEVSPGPVRRFTRRSLRAVRRIGRQVAADGPRAVAPVARRAVHQLPGPAQQQLRRVRRRVTPSAIPPAAAPASALPAAATPPPLVAPATRVPGANAAGGGSGSSATSGARSTARSLARRLPPPAAQRLRVTLIRVRRARAAPVPTAKRAVRRLPAPAQDASRRIWVRTAGVRRRGSRVVRASGRGPGATRRPAPKGRPFGEWKDGYRTLVRDTVPAGERWLVVAPGSPTEVRNATEPRALRFPDPPRRALADDLALVAHLEALRYKGHRFLVVPEGSRPWFRRQAEFRDHVVSTYRCAADETGAGIVFDLGTPAGETSSSLRHEVQRLAAGGAHDPAVLAWTDLDVDGELPGVTIFRPPAGTDLPYLDRSVEIVVRDDLRDRDEARRVATLGVVTVASAPDGLEVRSVDDLTSVGPGPAPTVLVRAGSGGDDAWTRELAARVAEEGADLEVGPLAPNGTAGVNGHDVVVLVEPYVLPLPGAIRAAAALAVEQPETAITGKVLRPDGRLDSAGGTVFFDRSVALIAEGSDDVRAPWHDYMRPVCWAPGLVAVSAALWGEVARPVDDIGRTLMREWCAAIWEHGRSVAYEPAVAAVRVAGSGGEPSLPLQESAWQRVLDLRPRRPEQLGDGEWRYLLAHDDVEACRG